MNIYKIYNTTTNEAKIVKSLTEARRLTFLDAEQTHKLFTRGHLKADGFYLIKY